MGYTTFFTIEFSSQEDKIKKYSNKLLKTDKKNFYWNDDNYAEWYSYEEDISRVSKKFPDTLITVYGQGEKYDADAECFDIWVQYFKGGMATEVHQAKIKIEYDSFDEDELGQID